MKKQLFALTIATFSFSFAFGLHPEDRAELERQESKIRGMEHQVGRLQEAIAKATREKALFQSEAHSRYSDTQGQKAAAESAE